MVQTLVIDVAYSHYCYSIYYIFLCTYDIQLSSKHYSKFFRIVAQESHARSSRDTLPYSQNIHYFQELYSTIRQIQRQLCFHIFSNIFFLFLLFIPLFPPFFHYLLLVFCCLAVCTSLSNYNLHVFQCTFLVYI